MNITTSEIKYLIMMGKNGLHNITEIAETLGISKPSVSIMIKKMLVKGLVNREKDYISLSDDGEKYYEYYLNLYERIEAYFLEKKISDNVKDYIWLFMSKIREDDLEKIISID